MAGVVAIVLAASACDGTTKPDADNGNANGSTGFQAQHKGGTLKLLAKSAAGSFDPQVNYTLEYWQLYQSMYDGLVAFKKVGGQDSFTVVPDLAEAMPQVTDGGKTYTFKLRKGIKFSTGKTVTVDDVVASFERIFKVSSPTAGTFYNGIVGADACLETPATCTLTSGVVADAAAGTVTIHLTAPDPEFLFKLAVPHASDPAEGLAGQGRRHHAVAHHRSVHGLRYDPNRALTLVRNPNFTEWSRDAQPQGVPRRDRLPVRPDRRGRGHRGAERPGRLGVRPAAGRPAQRDRHQVRRPGARQPADRLLVPHAQREPGAVRQRHSPGRRSTGRSTATR